MNWSNFEKGVFLVNILGIVYDPEKKKILIGRRGKDELVPELTWSFPGGKAGYKHSLPASMRMGIKRKTNLDVNVIDCIFARNLPENPEILLIYYFCEIVEDGDRPKAMDDFGEIKWIKPTEVEKYFTTSIDPVVMDFLSALEEGEI